MEKKNGVLKYVTENDLKDLYNNPKQFWEGVKEIGDGAFQGTALTSITIPDGVTKIDSGAFKNCINLTTITIPNSVTEIGLEAFQGCEKLTTITLPDSVTRIGDYAFYYCENLTTVTLPDGLNQIGDWAFSNCYNLTTISIPDSVKEIGVYAFEESDRLKSISVPFNIKRVGEDAFPEKATAVFKSPVRDYKVKGEMFNDEYKRYKDPKKNIRQIYLMSKNIPIYFARTDLDNNSVIFKDLLPYNNILKKYVYLDSDSFLLDNLNALIKLGSCLGLFSNETISKNNLNGMVVETPVSLQAEKVVKKMLNTVPFDDFDEYFGAMKLNKYSPNFLKYLSNSENLKNVFQSTDNGESLQEIYKKCVAKDKQIDTVKTNK